MKTTTNILQLCARTTLMLILAIGINISIAHAQASAPASTHKDWEAHVYNEGANKQCFITSTPKSLKGDYDRNNRDETRVYLTHRANFRDEISVFAGYRYRTNSEVAFDIDGKKFKLYIDGSYAWGFENQGPAIIKAMKRGHKLTVTGISSRGNTTIDIYSLSGFTAAYAAIGKLCPK